MERKSGTGTPEEDEDDDEEDARKRIPREDKALGRLLIFKCPHGREKTWVGEATAILSRSHTHCWSILNITFLGISVMQEIKWVKG